eukprot:6131727-Pleurochrysis_carterae.AAC.3
MGQNICVNCGCLADQADGHEQLHHRQQQDRPVQRLQEGRGDGQGAREAVRRLGCECSAPPGCMARLPPARPAALCAPMTRALQARPLLHQC